MRTFSELLNEIKQLPPGNLYVKRINGHKYFYHQYFLDGKQYSVLLKKDEALALRLKIVKRKELEKELKNIKSKQKNIVLSRNANELTGYVMSGNRTVAYFEKGVLISIDEKYAPLVIKRTKSLEEFLKLRVIDMSRTNARILKKVLHINVDDDFKSALYSYALSICDNYWFKPKHSKLKYQDIEFNDDSCFETSLKGHVSLPVFKNFLTPEITTTGSFEKGWRYIDNVWWLYKSGTRQQIFSELFSYNFAKLININTAIYEYDDGYIRSKNFADKYNFEPLAAYLGSNEDFKYVFDRLYELDKNIAKDYLKLVFFDAVVCNIDRHNENLGLLRDRNSGDIISLAPNFDNNLSLYSTNSELNAPNKDGMIKMLVDFLHKNENAKNLFLEIEFIDVDTSQVNDLLKQIPIEMEKEDILVNRIVERYYYLKDYFNK